MPTFFVSNRRLENIYRVFSYYLKPSKYVCLRVVVSCTRNDQSNGLKPTDAWKYKLRFI